MNNIILNEYEWVEAAIKQPGPAYANTYTINRYARYLADMGMGKAEIARTLEIFLARCDRRINLVFWQNAIDYAVQTGTQRPLVKMDGVVITKAEMESVDKLNGWLIRRLMFTMLCVAKFMNASRRNNNSWINIDTKTLFGMANINSLTLKRKALMLNELWKAGYIRYSKAVDNTNMRVKIIDDSSEQEVLISDFRNLGNRYMMLKGHDYFECADCGIVIKRRSNAHRYCDRCAVHERVRNVGGGSGNSPAA